MKQFFSGLLLSIFFISIELAAEPPHLKQQSNDCWLTSLTQIIYNMPNFIDALCGDKGNIYLSKQNPTLDETTAQKFVALVREIRAGKDAETRHSASLNELQDQFKKFEKEMEGSADSGQGLYFLTRCFFGLRDYWRMCFSDLCCDHFLYATFGLPENLKYPLLSNLNVGANPFVKGFVFVGDRFAMKKDAITVAGEYIFFVIESPGAAVSFYNFPAELDFGKYLAPALLDQWKEEKKSTHYELIGISLWEGGHYSARIKDQYDLTRLPVHPWYHCDSLGDRVRLVRYPNRDLLQKAWDMSIYGIHPRILVYRQMSQERFEKDYPKEQAEFVNQEKLAAEEDERLRIEEERQREEQKRQEKIAAELAKQRRIEEERRREEQLLLKKLVEALRALV